MRSADDGSKLAYPDEEQRVPQLIDATIRQQGSSDRFHGRKLHYQLYRAGFRDITIGLHPITTVGMSTEERNALFVESFSYRGNYLLRAMESGTAGPNAEEELQDIDLALRELELDFEEEHFFHQEIVMSAIAFVQRTT